MMTKTAQEAFALLAAGDELQKIALAMLEEEGFDKEAIARQMAQRGVQAVQKGWSAAKNVGSRLKQKLTGRTPEYSKLMQGRTTPDVFEQVRSGAPTGGYGRRRVSSGMGQSAATPTVSPGPTMTGVRAG